jgi:hypothetical protein
MSTHTTKSLLATTLLAGFAAVSFAQTSTTTPAPATAPSPAATSATASAPT